MSLTDVLQQTGVIDSMARELGIDPQTARTGAGALLPAIVAGMGRNQVGAAGAGSGGGLADILGGLAQGGLGSGLGGALGGALGGGLGGGSGGSLGGSLGGVLLDAVLHKDPTPTGPGNDILGQIFGSKDVSRGVAEEVAGSTGISADTLKKMLPILAMAVVGHMLNQHQGGAQAQPGGSGGGGLLGGALGGILSQVVAGMMR